ncbi:MAG: hypothetical protein ACTS1Z_08370 [Parasphingopyxis sp.]|uniref:hypothetical protein n=1 Tax=Parasphingopyxis sp. TaxID=1920299 RepID=UPI003F9F87BE
MRYLVILAAIGVVACDSTPVREQAQAECDRQAEALPASVDADAFCECVTEGITDDSTIAEANEAITARAQQCTQEVIQQSMGV